jgi:hypothetical protein
MRDTWLVWTRLNPVRTAVVAGLPDRSGPVVLAGSAVGESAAFAVYATADDPRAWAEAYGRVCDRVGPPNWRISQAGQAGLGVARPAGRAIGLLVLVVTTGSRAQTARRLSQLAAVAGWVADDHDRRLLLVWVTGNRPAAVDVAAAVIGELPGVKVRVRLRTSVDRLVRADDDQHAALVLPAAGEPSGLAWTALAGLPTPGPAGSGWTVTLSWLDLDERSCVTVPARWLDGAPVGSVVLVGDHDGNTCRASVVSQTLGRVPLATLHVDTATFTVGPGRTARAAGAADQ